MAPKRRALKKHAKGVPNSDVGRKPRVLFLGRKVAISDGKTALAKAALERARKKNRGGARRNGMLK